jgi:hypothetical protein
LLSAGSVGGDPLVTNSFTAGTKVVSKEISLGLAVFPEKNSSIVKLGSGPTQGGNKSS